MEHIEQIRDQLLVLLCQLGDKAAFGTLFERYYGPITYYVRRLLDDEDSADDIVQDVWLAVFRRIRTLKDPEAFRVWVYRIARNKAIGTRRARRFWKLLDEESPEEAVPADDDLPSERAEQVHACLRGLRPHHREVLTLRFMQQMNYEQISAVLDCPIGTVKSRLYHAKQSLLREMERNYDAR